MGCNGYKKKCWQKEKSDSLCGTCEFAKQKEMFNAILSQNIALVKIYTNLESLTYRANHSSSDSILNRDIYFDRIVRRLLDDKVFLKEFLEKYKSRFDYRVYMHSESEMCDVVCWALHTGKMELPIPNSCLKCLAHTLRYSPDKYTKNLILRSVIFSYNDGPKIQTIARRMKKESSLYEFGLAIIEQQGSNGVYDTYINTIKDKTRVLTALHEHILLHNTHNIHITHNTHNTDNTHNTHKTNTLELKSKIDEFKEELIAATYEPSRVFDWCIAEEDKMAGWGCREFTS